jgi:hypothetical protein
VSTYESADVDCAVPGDALVTLESHHHRCVKSVARRRRSTLDEVVRE